MMHYLSSILWCTSSIKAKHFLVFVSENKKVRVINSFKMILKPYATWKKNFSNLVLFQWAREGMGKQQNQYVRKCFLSFNWEFLKILLIFISWIWWWNLREKNWEPSILREWRMDEWIIQRREDGVDGILLKLLQILRRNFPSGW